MQTLRVVNQLAAGGGQGSRLDIGDVGNEGKDAGLFHAFIGPDALPDAPMTGVVESISQAFIMQGGDVLYRVKIKVDEVDPRALWGMTVEVTFEPME